MKIKIGNGTGACKVKQVFIIHMRLPDDLREFEPCIELNKEPVEIDMPAYAAAAQHIGTRPGIITPVVTKDGYLVVVCFSHIACISKPALSINEIFRIAFACFKINAVFKIALVTGKVAPILGVT